MIPMFCILTFHQQASTPSLFQTLVPLWHQPASTYSGQNLLGLVQCKNLPVPSALQTVHMLKCKSFSRISDLTEILRLRIIFSHHDARLRYDLDSDIMP